MTYHQKVVFCLCVVLGGVAFTGYKLGHLADDLLVSSSLLAETRQVQRAKPICSDDPIKHQVAETVREKFRRQGFEV